MKKNHFSFSASSRRDLLRLGMYGIGVSAAAVPMPLFAQAAAALRTRPIRTARLRAKLRERYLSCSSFPGATMG